MSNFVKIGEESYPKINTDMLVSVEEVNIKGETKYKHSFLGGLIMVLDHDLSE